MAVIKTRADTRAMQTPVRKAELVCCCTTGDVVGDVVARATVVEDEEVVVGLVVVVVAVVENVVEDEVEDVKTDVVCVVVELDDDEFVVVVVDRVEAVDVVAVDKGLVSVADVWFVAPLPFMEICDCWHPVSTYDWAGL